VQLFPANVSEGALSLPESVWAGASTILGVGSDFFDERASKNMAKQMKITQIATLAEDLFVSSISIRLLATDSNQRNTIRAGCTRLRVRGPHPCWPVPARTVPLKPWSRGVAQAREEVPFLCCK